MKIKIHLSIVFLLLTFTAHTSIKLSSLISDNMVLQQNSDIKIWGKAAPNQNINVKVEWQKRQLFTTANDKGDWALTVKTINAGGPYKIVVTSKNEKIEISNILLGEVWLCTGQSNMEMPMAGFADSPINGSTDALLNYNPNVRMFKVTRAVGDLPFDTCSGTWAVANPETIAKSSAVAYFFANVIQQSLHVPIGVITCSWGGSRIESWMKKDILTNFPNALKQTSNEKLPANQRVSNIYNGMIAPLTNYKIKGALWYQGESNIVNYYDYDALLASMVKNWRTDFGNYEFPFYYVEIAPHSYGNSNAKNAALQREAQFRAMSLIPNSGMVCTADVGEEKNIHPAEKLTISKRLALWALSETYGIKGLPYKSPTYKNMTVKDSVVSISFDNLINGLSFTGNEITGFEIAGADSVFYKAKAIISQKQIRAWSSNVKQPVAVRYAFVNYLRPEGLVFNTAGLPVLPFRTDNWKK